MFLKKHVSPKLWTWLYLLDNKAHIIIKDLRLWLLEVCWLQQRKNTTSWHRQHLRLSVKPITRRQISFSGFQWTRDSAPPSLFFNPNQWNKQHCFINKKLFNIILLNERRNQVMLLISDVKFSALLCVCQWHQKQLLKNYFVHSLWVFTLFVLISVNWFQSKCLCLYNICVWHVYLY